MHTSLGAESFGGRVGGDNLRSAFANMIAKKYMFQLPSESELVEL